MPAKEHQKVKGNPASHRMMNATHKAAHARSWVNGQVRKKARNEAQAKREAANRALTWNGNATPWEIACAARKVRRGL